jgi:hypothetical protein
VIRGPFTAENITRYILLGRIRLDDELSEDRDSWSTANYFSELLPPEVQNLSNWDDYQQLVEARREVDERKGERRCQNCVNRDKCRRERRGKINRRVAINHSLSIDDKQVAGKSAAPATARTLLMALLLATLLFSWLVPVQAS